MIVELISVGTELLLGNIVNTNAAYLSEQCAALGLSCYHQSVVGDNEERLTESISQALKRSDIIILSGGLGPTQDDLTKETVAKVVGRELYLDEKSMKEIQGFFRRRGIEPTENNWKQAMMPEGSIIIENKNGTAPGVIVEENGKVILLLPGPPNELKPMFEQDMVPYLRKLQPGIIYSKTVKLCGIGESKVETMIVDMLETCTNPTIAPYAKTGEVHLRVTAKVDNEEQGEELIAPIIKELKHRFGKEIYTTDEKVNLEDAVVELLKKRDFTISVAESCTGGMLAARLVQVPGVSEVFQAGYITYSNKAKRRDIGVKKNTLAEYGAVSKQVAKEMSKGAAKTAKTNVALSITGIAGPDGGTTEKPVGLVYIGCTINGKTKVNEYRFSGSRSKIRETTVSYALTFLRNQLLEWELEEMLG